MSYLEGVSLPSKSLWMNNAAVKEAALKGGVTKVRVALPSLWGLYSRKALGKIKWSLCREKSMVCALPLGPLEKDGHGPSTLII